MGRDGLSDGIGGMLDNQRLNLRGSCPRNDRGVGRRLHGGNARGRSDVAGRRTGTQQPAAFQGLDTRTGHGAERHAFGHGSSAVLSPSISGAAPSL